MAAVSLTPAGPFSLAAGIRFLKGFTPASNHHAGDGILRLAFPADDATVGAIARLARIADGWKPYRSWVALLLRTRAQATDRPGPA
ncbi:hypothetical protein Sgleb_14620 [Streptomyces glebosus]|uniref:Uncharacterized protein n=1 Tax=Streptomyces glebosus TaxID=249580 RepID=A0A640SV46_9ACTN|nr:hypothetical protein [Streptomyces glebosus]GFE13415.1 hypothetical protein Sgleb_14620 [Streptomyces glebosus]GHG90783.1 hypothetical protein GCM10010513_74130 [Streptomyces glebosus]